MNGPPDIRLFKAVFPDRKGSKTIEPKAVRVARREELARQIQKENERIAAEMAKTRNTEESEME